MCMLQLPSAVRSPVTTQAPPASSLLEGASAGESDVDRVYNEIFDAVMDRRLLPGAKLTESALCRVFDCSRATVRGALAELAHRHIVTLLPNRGAFVASPGPKETRDVFEMRRAIEEVVIDRLLAMPDLPNALQSLYGMVAQEQHAFETGDRIGWLRLSNAFHVRLACLVGNDVLSEMMHGLCARTTIIIAQQDAPADSTCSYHEHRQILDRLAAGDRQGVLDAMHHHLRDCEVRVNDTPGLPADPWAAFGVRA